MVKKKPLAQARKTVRGVRPQDRKRCRTTVPRVPTRPPLLHEGTKKGLKARQSIASGIARRKLRHSIRQAESLKSK
ncbi:MAG: hypothetical protein FWF09_05680 [Bacteroidales bacterium]|nr:hypothetical protein [Bacteroidales bacterium]